MTKAIENRVTQEVLAVELELGEQLWVLDEHGSVHQALRAHFPLERWRFIGAMSQVDDVPVPLARPVEQRAAA